LRRARPSPHGGGAAPDLLMAAFALESSAFEHAQALPSRPSCAGEDVAPPLLLPEFARESTPLEHAQAIPSRHSCEGEDVSPPLRWSNAPEGTRSLALVVDDPAAPGGVFTHWLVWGLDPAGGELGEGESVPSEGRNDFGRTGYRGPCPPPGHGDRESTRLNSR